MRVPRRCLTAVRPVWFTLNPDAAGAASSATGSLAWRMDAVTVVSGVCEDEREDEGEGECECEREGEGELTTTVLIRRARRALLFTRELPRAPRGAA
jgi:hypothetical protein